MMLMNDVLKNCRDVIENVKIYVRQHDENYQLLCQIMKNNNRKNNIRHDDVLGNALDSTNKRFTG